MKKSIFRLLYFGWAYCWREGPYAWSLEAHPFWAWQVSVFFYDEWHKNEPVWLLVMHPDACEQLKTWSQRK